MIQDTSPVSLTPLATRMLWLENQEGIHRSKLRERSRPAQSARCEIWTTTKSKPNSVPSEEIIVADSTTANRESRSEFVRDSPRHAKSYSIAPARVGLSGCRLTDWRCNCSGCCYAGASS